MAAFEINVRSARAVLLGAGLLSAGIALLHVGIALGGPSGYVYFGAPELAPRAAAGSLFPAVLTFGLALIFAIWAWYAFAAAGATRKPPLLTLGLWAIGIVYTLRGIAIVPELLALARGGSTPPRFVAFSLVALIAGVLYLIGALARAKAARASFS